MSLGVSALSSPALIFEFNFIPVILSSGRGMEGIIITPVYCLLVRLILLVLFQDRMSGLRMMKESDMPLNLHLFPLSIGRSHLVHF